MSETASLNKTPMSYWIHSAVYLFLTFGMGYIPTESISSLGMSIVGILSACSTDGHLLGLSGQV